MTQNESVGGLTPLGLQQALITDFAALFSDQLFKKPQKKVADPEELVPITWYKQALPWEKGYEYGKYAPYGAVVVKKGKYDDQTEPMDLIVFVVFAIFDDALENQGHISILNLIEKLRRHIFSQRIIGGYAVRMPFEFEISDEDNHPYFVGAVETHWAMPIIAAEDPNL